MAANSSVWYSIKIEELYVILAALNVTRWYGFGVNDAEMPGTCEDINRMLANLYRNEVVSFKNTEIVLEKGYSDIFHTLKASNKCLCTVSAYGCEKTVLSYFAEDQVVVMEHDTVKHDMISLLLLSKSSWPRFILKEITSINGISKGKINVPDEVVRTFKGKETGAEEVALLPDVLAVFDTVNIESGKIIERLTIREKGLFQYLVLEKPDSESISIMDGGISETGRFLSKWA